MAQSSLGIAIGSRLHLRLLQSVDRSRGNFPLGGPLLQVLELFDFQPIPFLGGAVPAFAQISGEISDLLRSAAAPGRSKAKWHTWTTRPRKRTGQRTHDRQRAVGHDQVAGVWRRDAIALGQGHDLIYEFFLLAVDADLVEHVADLAAGPQVFHERLLFLGLLREDHLVSEILLVLADHAGQGHGRLAPLAVVAAQHDELGAVEQIGQLRRIDLIQLDVAADGQLQVGQHGIADLGVEPGDLVLNVFGFADKGRK